MALPPAPLTLVELRIMNDGVWARCAWWEEPSSPYPSAEPLVPNSKTAKIQLGRWIYSIYYSLVSIRKNVF